MSGSIDIHIAHIESLFKFLGGLIAESHFQVVGLIDLSNQRV